MEEVLSRTLSALGAHEFASLGNVLDQAELEQPDLFDTPEWPHAVQIMGHIFANNLEDARFVYKRIPNKIKAENGDIKAAFSLLQRLWVTDYEGIWAALSYSWPDQLQDLSATLRGRLQDRILTIVQRAYSNITAKNLGRLLGMPQQEAAHCAIEKGWAVDDSGLIAPKPASGHSIWEPTEADLQKLAQYVVFLQAGEPAPTAP